jgi:hypothetical protein
VSKIIVRLIVTHQHHEYLDLTGRIVSDFTKCWSFKLKIRALNSVRGDETKKIRNQIERT